MMESKAVRWFLAFMIFISILFMGLVSLVYAGFQIVSRLEANVNSTEKAAREAQKAGDKAEEATDEAEQAGTRAEESRIQSERNEDLLNIVLAITGCTVDDTPEACAQRVGTASQEEGNRRILEVDCRIRRALAGQPAPEGVTCIPER